MMNWRLAGGIALLLLLTACRLPGTGSSCDTVAIDWVNFIQVGSNQYVAGPQAATVLPESELGPVIGQVKFKVSGNVCDPAYRPKDGDAAFLDPGTQIYEIKGRLPSEALAARFNGQIVLYLVQPTR
jgi:hypothetical protein